MDRRKQHCERLNKNQKGKNNRNWRHGNRCYRVKGKVVHHIDGNRFNNEPENLYHFDTISQHTKYHAFLRSLVRQAIRTQQYKTCGWCEKKFNNDKALKPSAWNERQFCDKSCACKSHWARGDFEERIKGECNG